MHNREMTGISFHDDNGREFFDLSGSGSAEIGSPITLNIGFDIDALPSLTPHSGTPVTRIRVAGNHTFTADYVFVGFEFFDGPESRRARGFFQTVS